MYLKELEISGFKSFAKKSNLKFGAPISAIVGPNGSGKSNIAEAFRFVLGEQSFKSMRGKRGEDLIFNGTPSVGKQARATVRVTFDNSDKTLPIDFDDVTLERTVHRDGVNEYSINGSQVRLKDVAELLASANIGSSGHHIISQGEADRILNSSPKERKAMLEDALGLKIFQYKKNESEKKLVKTDENIAQVQSLRKEIAPHIKFLKKQVEKIEQGKQLKIELLSFYKEYLFRESNYVAGQKQILSHAIDAPRKRLAQVDSEIAEAEALSAAESQEQTQNESTVAIKSLEGQISDITNEKENLLKEEGRIEGQITSLQKISEKAERATDNISIGREELQDLKKRIDEIDLDSQQAVASADVSVLKNLLKKATDLVREFLNNKTEDEDAGSEIKEEIKKHQNRQTEIANTLQQISQKESALRSEIVALRQKLDEDKSTSLEAEKKIIVLMSEKNELQQDISKHAVALDNLNRDEEDFKREIAESVALVGRDALEYENMSMEIVPEMRTEQQERRKKLERMKIKVEDIGIGSNDDIIREFSEATERDEFLVKEIEDLEQSAASLQTLIDDLGQKIEIKFHEGVSKINHEFQEFFELMFGGGSASIKIVKTEMRRKKDTDISFDANDMDSDAESGDEEENTEEGIEIKVNLPRKKISGLMMLSGGERALTSIALLFAISQVNPPPFVILDETDAALDEANSRKYGDMIENLSKNSQLILITHNRETMGRAGILYGVTMSGGVSQLLSVAFDEGVEWAK